MTHFAAQPLRALKASSRERYSASNGEQIKLSVFAWWSDHQERFRRQRSGGASFFFCGSSSFFFPLSQRFLGLCPLPLVPWNRKDVRHRTSAASRNRNAVTTVRILRIAIVTAVSRSFDSVGTFLPIFSCSFRGCLIWRDLLSYLFRCFKVFFKSGALSRTNLILSKQRLVALTRSLEIVTFKVILFCIHNIQRADFPRCYFAPFSYSSCTQCFMLVEPILSILWNGKYFIWFYWVSLFQVRIFWDFP